MRPPIDTHRSINPAHWTQGGRSYRSTIGEAEWLRLVGGSEFDNVVITNPARLLPPCPSWTVFFLRKNRLEEEVHRAAVLAGLCVHKSWVSHMNWRRARANAQKEKATA